MDQNVFRLCSVATQSKRQSRMYDAQICYCRFW